MENGGEKRDSISRGLRSTRWIHLPPRHVRVAWLDVAQRGSMGNDPSALRGQHWPHQIQGCPPPWPLSFHFQNAASPSSRRVVIHGSVGPCGALRRRLFPPSNFHARLASLLSVLIRHFFASQPTPPGWMRHFGQCRVKFTGGAARWTERRSECGHSRRQSTKHGRVRRDDPSLAPKSGISAPRRPNFAVEIPVPLMPPRRRRPDRNAAPALPDAAAALDSPI